MEWNHGFTYQQRTRAGRLFYKLPNLSFPFRESELLLATGHQTHTDAEVAAPIEAGALDPTLIMAAGKAARCVADAPHNATFQIAAGKHVSIGTLETDVSGGSCAWRLIGSDAFLRFPRYFDEELQPVAEAQVPPEFAAQDFPLDKGVFSRTFDAITAPKRCYNFPGPSADTLYCAQSKVNKYWLGWRWYRFVDQPALQRQQLTAQQRDFMQRRIETLHNVTGPISR